MEKLSAAEVDPKNVVVEMPESTAMAGPDGTQRVLSDALHAWGLTLAVDDFQDRLLVARSPEAPAGRRPQDRSVVHPRCRPGPGFGPDGGGDGAAGPQVGMTPLAEEIETPRRAHVHSRHRVPPRPGVSCSRVPSPRRRSRRCSLGTPCTHSPEQEARRAARCRRLRLRHAQIRRRDRAEVAAGLGGPGTLSSLRRPRGPPGRASTRSTCSATLGRPSPRARGEPSAAAT